MAKIENTTVYPTVTPAADDLLIATDVSDDNKTVTFLVSSLTGGAGVLQGLQSVLDTGNTATQTMELTGSITLLGGAGTGFIDLCQIKLGGSYGTAGQVLTSAGPSACATWETPASTSCCNLSDTLTAGNTATNTMTLTGLGTFTGAGGGIAVTSGGTLTTDGTSVATFDNAVNLGTTINFGATTTLNDYSGATGTAGQILVVNAAGTGVEWSTGVPTASMPNLQQVLTAGNTATGVGIQLTNTSPLTLDATSNITSDGTNTWNGNNTFSGTGFLAGTAGVALTGTLWDGSSVGTAGQVLTSTGSGIQWSSSAGVTSVTAQTPATSTGTPLIITPTTGAVQVTQHIYAGGSNIGVVPSGGTASDFLQGDGTWGTAALQDLTSVLTQGNTAANSITLTGASNSITAYTGVFTSIQDGTGATGAASQVPTADGAGGWVWGTPAAGAVTSVTTAASAVSTGAPLVITPTSGAVTVSSRSFGGSSNIGHVPSSAAVDQVKNFLRADGTWTAPVTAATNTDTVLITTDWNMNGVHNGGYWTYMGYDQADFQTSYRRINNLLPNIPTGTSYTAADHNAGFFFINPELGTCSTQTLTVCSITMTIVGSPGGSISAGVYVGNPCDPDAALALVSRCTFEASEGVISCCSGTISLATIAAGEGLFLAIEPTATAITQVYSGHIAIRAAATA